jgi:hypothetical protein
MTEYLFAGDVGDDLRAQHERLRDFVLGLDANAVLPPRS